MMPNLLDNIRIVLINTSHPGNIGSTARAMKTMGLTNLFLVEPKEFPSSKATALAAGADDVLMRAKVVANLDAAVHDCHLLVGTSARERTLPWPILNARQCAEKLMPFAHSQQIAILFGCETSGLRNRDLQRCHYHVQIPTASDYGSLNLAQAVQIICYELRMAAFDSQPMPSTVDENVKNYEMEMYYAHLERTLRSIQFIKPNVPNQIMPRLRRLFNRARPNKVELNILRGILSEMERGV